MRTKLSLLIAMLTLAVAVIGSSSASAAILYTTTAHTTAVTVGTTFSASTPTGGTNNYSWFNTTYSTDMLQCQSAVYSFTVTQNSAGVFKATTNNTGTSFNTCAPGGTPVSQASPATLQVSGSSITVGTGKAWLGTTLSNVAINSTYGLETGTLVSATGNPPANGASAQQPAASKPVTIAFSKAGALGDAFWGPTFKVTGNYTLTGTAADYSFN